MFVSKEGRWLGIKKVANRIMRPGVCVCVSIKLRNGPKGLYYFQLVLKSLAADVVLRSNNKGSLINVWSVCVFLFHRLVLHACVFVLTVCLDSSVSMHICKIVQMSVRMKQCFVCLCVCLCISCVALINIKCIWSILSYILSK